MRSGGILLNQHIELNAIRSGYFALLTHPSAAVSRHCQKISEPCSNISPTHAQARRRCISLDLPQNCILQMHLRVQDIARSCLFVETHFIILSRTQGSALFQSLPAFFSVRNCAQRAAIFSTKSLNPTSMKFSIVKLSCD